MHHVHGDTVAKIYHLGLFGLHPELYKVHHAESRRHVLVSSAR